jgi:titin
VGVSAPQNAPTSLSATPANTSVSIAFTPPTDNGGMDINNYQYAISSNGGSTYSAYAALSPADGVSPITVTGLTQNTAYLIKLKAVNDVGVSDVESSAVSFTSQGVPTSAPSSLSAIQTDTSVSISFTAAASSTSLTNYEYSFNNSSWTALSPADAVSPVTISGLSQNTAYTVYLRGVNSYGSGAGSTGVSFTTLGPPTGTATITSITNITQTTATVNFTVAAGGGAITGYDLYVANFTNAWNNTTGSPISVTGLTAGTTYTFYVRAKNAYGVGPQSAGVNGSTPILGEFMVVGGGGGGANGFNNGQVGVTCFGGGGGGTSISSNVVVSAGVYTMNVGGAGTVNGGTGGTSSVVFGGSTLYSAAGGNGSYADRYPFGGAGGSGSTSNGTAGSQTGYTVAVGGYSNAFDGTTRTYGSGGGANPAGGGSAGADGEGDGGQSGGGGNPSPGNRGGTGIAMLKILTSNTGRITATSGTVSAVVTGSYTVYRWTSSGTVTVS